ncbi:ergothioneine biosynthesis glutamate--cysteine ligase EgtA [Trujillonella endophytica]|uniref:Glutamate--cysteine ligase EgtA n=1 Tax=Trujillonella endophytica TaxID=673521 RepID=A0A1H8WQB8_9ACTN|nr:ergothioneine biosynthesis glutamate--cysteine ligase EgtA [Trujillella endophytica]SEP29841.1 glutamate--cysteine ligase [Trujillella endophytica]
MAPRTEQRSTEQRSAEQGSRTLDLDTAFAAVAAGALHDGPVGVVGLELEGHLVDLDRPAARVPWSRICGVLAGVPPLPGGSRVTCEPGGQVELSGPPLPDVAAAVAALRADRAVLGAVLAADRLALAPVGADPFRPSQRVNPAARYGAMEQHFAAAGCAGAGTAMMTSTASLQVNLEAGPAAGWSERVARAHRLGPVLVAVSACSPLLGGRPTGWRSTRQQVWGALDQARCGPVLRGDDPAGEWAAYALAAPVMLVRDGAGAEPVRGRVAFSDWVSGEVPLGGRGPTAADLDYHLTTLFPPVRPRGWLEIRYLDAAPEPWWPALAAVTTVLLDDPVAADRAAEACAATRDAWDLAARAGLADPALRAAARGCLAAAVDAVPATLRPEVEALAELVESGRDPGSALDDALHAGGPAAALLATTGDAPERGTAP